MKKTTTILALVAFFSFSTRAQVTAFSFNSEDLSETSVIDQDNDGNNWGAFSGGGQDFGFTGAFLFSESFTNDDGALTPDNLIVFPTFSLPEDAVEIEYSMLVNAQDITDFAENYAVYVYDEATGVNLDTNIFEETLTAGGEGNSKTITATIPDSFAGEAVGIILRHYECTDEFRLFVDDLLVTYTSTLSTTAFSQFKFSFAPNPVQDIITLTSEAAIDTVVFYNILGKQIKKYSNTTLTDKSSINLSEFPTGYYFMEVLIKDTSKIFRVVKQ